MGEDGSSKSSTWRQPPVPSKECAQDMETNREDPQAQDNAPRRHAPRMSAPSEIALRKLNGTNIELSHIENRVKEIVSALDSSVVEEIAPLKSELAQLETKAKQLEGKGVDDIYTSDLNSGKQLAKDEKKDMLCRFETLYANVDKACGKSSTWQNATPPKDCAQDAAWPANP